jgi:hypothetical protein
VEEIAAARHPDRENPGEVYGSFQFRVATDEAPRTKRQVLHGNETRYRPAQGGFPRISQHHQVWNVSSWKDLGRRPGNILGAHHDDESI